MGTPDIAAKCLEQLVNDGHEVVGAVTRQDKPKGRGHKLVPTEVKAYAITKDIPVYQPESLKDGVLQPVLDELKPDIIAVVAYGRILPEYVLKYPKFGCVNMHASKLPKYRGAAPIQRAVLNGESETAASVMLMDEGLDTGDILSEEIIKIGEEETSGELFDKMAEVGARLLSDTIKNIESITPRKQEGESTYAHMITKEEAHIDWSKPTAEIINLIRGMNPAPLAYTYYEDALVKILTAKASDAKSGKAGEILSVSKDGMLVKSGDGAVLVKTVRFPMKNTMSIADYIRGNTIETGVVLA